MPREPEVPERPTAGPRADEVLPRDAWTYRVQEVGPAAPDLEPQRVLRHVFKACGPRLGDLGSPRADPQCPEHTAAAAV